MSSLSDVSLSTSSAEAQVLTKTFDKPLTKGMLRVKIYTPFKTFYENDAHSLSALNESGVFDVLPGHHNFISMLLPCNVIVEAPDKEKRSIPIHRGLMHVKEDRVIVFLDV